jgi:sugar lactone lactonase YvrE
MSSMRFVLAASLVVLAACGDAEPPAVDATVAESTAQDLDSVVLSAIEAHRAGDYDRAVELSLQAEAMLPNHPRLLFNTACAMALGGDTEAALDRLERIAAMQYAVDLEASASMAPLREEPRFNDIRQAMAAIAEPMERSSVAFTVPDPTFLVEGVAHDPATGDLFLSSLYLRRIARVHPDGEMVPFTEPSKDLWSMLGMAVDAENGHLWSITVGGPRMQDAAPDEPTQSALVQFSLKNGSETARFEAPSGIEGSVLDSLAVGRDGAVYVSDSGAGAIHRLPPGGRHLEVMVPPGTFLSTQGLELSADETVLYAADYGRGVAAVNVDTGEVQFLEHDGPCLLGIDGLERHGDDLIAIQNGIQPPRVVRIFLGPDGRTIASVETLERAHHLYREPTLGTVVGDDLIYVASSQWRSFDEEGHLLRDELVEPTILRLPLTE